MSWKSAATIGRHEKANNMYVFGSVKQRQAENFLWKTAPKSMRQECRDGFMGSATNNSQQPMSRAPLRFRESDVTRAIKAVKKAGVAWGLEILTDGTIRLVPSSTSTEVKSSNYAPEERDEANPWDLG